jgi:alkanesulfonate monooxygenase SsuD/methylene tetrahydromethanopterin reductase-like flavin-dependent oxidoreductase (luciferase family)
VPIWLGTSSTAGRSLRRAARHASGWFMTYPTTGQYREANHKLDALLRQAGRQPAAVVRSALLRCHVSGDPAAAREPPERLLSAHDRAIAELIGQPLPAETAHVRARHLIGGPQEITERLLGYRAAGMEHAVVSFVPVADSFAAMDIFARDVLPSVQTPSPVA